MTIVSSLMDNIMAGFAQDNTITYSVRTYKFHMPDMMGMCRFTKFMF